MPMNYKAPRRTNNSKIAQRRISAGLTQAKLANILGTSQAMVSHWEVGYMPRKNMLIKMANFFKCEVGDLIDVD